MLIQHVNLMLMLRWSAYVLGIYAENWALCGGRNGTSAGGVLIPMGNGNVMPLNFLNRESRIVQGFQQGTSSSKPDTASRQDKRLRY